jgi:hypothetical protein
MPVPANCPAANVTYSVFAGFDVTQRAAGSAGGDDEHHPEGTTVAFERPTLATIA